MVDLIFVKNWFYNFLNVFNIINKLIFLVRIISFIYFHIITIFHINYNIFNQCLLLIFNTNFNT